MTTKLDTSQFFMLFFVHQFRDSFSEILTISSCVCKEKNHQNNNNTRNFFQFLLIFYMSYDPYSLCLDRDKLFLAINLQLKTFMKCLFFHFWDLLVFLNPDPIRIRRSEIRIRVWMDSIGSVDPDSGSGSESRKAKMSH